MSLKLKLAPASVAAVALTLAFAAALLRFAVQPGLASFADDSVSYLVMAQAMSPWQPAAPAVAEAFRGEATYPPLFPLVLALAGAAHDIARAHAVTVLLLAAWLPLVYLLGFRWLGHRGAALAAAAITALLPAVWVNAKGVLSEPLYGLALLACLLALEMSPERRLRAWAIAACLAALVLTRTAGAALVAAWMLWAASRPGLDLRARLLAALPGIAALMAYGLWALLRPAEAVDSNVRLLGERLAEIDLARQGWSIAEAWTGSLLLYWVQGRYVQVLLGALVGIAALAGMVLRFRAGKADAWLLAAYLATFLVWPFSDQMGRFLFPALPVLLLYAFLAVGRAAARAGRRAELGQGMLTFLLAALCVPPLAFIYQRAQAPAPHSAITEWYRTPDLREARTRAATHVDLFTDMQVIHVQTAAADRVMWVTPAYLALLADRRGVRAPNPRLDVESYRKAVRASGADFVFLSLYHPRDTLSDAAWQAGVKALYGEAKVVHVGTRAGGELVTSMLLRLK